MLSVTFADLWYRYRQFLIAVVGAGLVLAMGLLMAGLAAGFRVETVQTLGGVGADSWVMTRGSDGHALAVHVFPEADLLPIRQAPGVGRADPLVLVPQQTARIGHKTSAVNVMGVVPGGLGDPSVTAGSSLSGRGQVVVDDRARAAVGGSLGIGSYHYRVVGLVQGRTLMGGGPMVYMSLTDAQSLVLGGRPFVTAVVTVGRPTSVPPGLAAFPESTVVNQTLDQLATAVSSINNSKLLMWIVAVIIVAALLYVSALQRVRDFAVLKALGASSGVLFSSLCVQAVIVTLVAAAFGAAVSTLMHGVFAQPVAVPASAFATLPLVAVVVGVISSLVALRRATGADPAAAFGGP